MYIYVCIYTYKVIEYPTIEYIIIINEHSKELVETLQILISPLCAALW